jgi:high-affinity Fe2+/Pb2+ permease
VIYFHWRAARTVHMTDKTLPDQDAAIEKKAAMVAGLIVALAAAVLVAWGILEFLLRQ